MVLFQLASAPVLAGIFYLYIRDRYEKEPWRMVAAGTVYGWISAFLTYGAGTLLEGLLPHEETPFYTAFFSAALIEEGVKFLLMLGLILPNRQFNEPFDGIVYAVFLSLGFAWVENLVYVVHPVMGGYGTALSRAVLSVPGHGLFGVQMGYYLGRRKFGGGRWQRWAAFMVPFALHGAYDYFLLRPERFWDIPFWGLEVFLWILGLRRMRELLERSPFRPTG
ncbi:PrsW family intramembrane metalloprotease [Anaerotignum lactatifermentans]|uniref:Protease PrsW n=1 Tax=Anaerotignum lactatifermentans TaxID=160404 RepID=A0ABS2G7S0_9FIRM|nr:PrsW family glutamic-type intramembrane protease [Anaerotignum lactatifermentans]MBM6828229.1 PrsW family intramembrane metalloprotease [Anaerotignum lactatifermentans]MBM6876608.1 PrsW family intramembrane metalloprotease [Anaerotignum lactatifermentans]MBM6949812.1 PrsW family intramembrane metalloprotease [Anaerotignum lactatifermentans]